VIPLVRRLADKILHDELAVRRWGRALLMAVAGGGIAFGSQLADALGDSGLTQAIKVVAIVAGFLSLAITAGEKNAKPEPIDNEKTPTA
jgi:hypothetical protein